MRARGCRTAASRTGAGASSPGRGAVGRVEQLAARRAGDQAGGAAEHAGPVSPDQACTSRTVAGPTRRVLVTSCAAAGGSRREVSGLAGRTPVFGRVCIDCRPGPRPTAAPGRVARGATPWARAAGEIRPLRRRQPGEPGEGHRLGFDQAAAAAASSRDHSCAPARRACARSPAGAWRSAAVPRTPGGAAQRVGCAAVGDQRGQVLGATVRRGAARSTAGTAPGPAAPPGARLPPARPDPAARKQGLRRATAAGRSAD